MISICGNSAPLSNDQIVRIEADGLNPMNWCCMGASMRGPGGCTCWEATFSKVQREIDVTLEPWTRERPCEDCAYRPDSAEWNDERRENLEAIAHNDEAPFWCHQGMRHVVRWRHSITGMVVEAPRDDAGAICTWAPPKTAGVPYKASGEPADRCAGWAARRRLAVREAVG